VATILPLVAQVQAPKPFGAVPNARQMVLREVIELGHRTTGWNIDYSSDNSSYTSLLSDKQSIGYKWLEKFEPVTARYVRLNITKSQA
jgi:alpha-L-fucosidase